VNSRVLPFLHQHGHPPTMNVTPSGSPVTDCLALSEFPWQHHRHKKPSLRCAILIRTLQHMNIRWVARSDWVRFVATAHVCRYFDFC
jgi:hypothetical protein